MSLPLTGVFTKIIRGDGVFSRALRGSAWTVSGSVLSQFIRLASNLVLTRILFPEAFGMMALIMVFLQGLMSFSDVGTTPAIMQSKRGDDPVFLNTAWTIQIIRGATLWLISCGLAWPIAAFYGEPALIYLMPVAGLSLLIAGFYPTRLDTAQRHLLLGRVTIIDLLQQVGGIAAIILFAWLLQSVWALVIGQIFGAALRLVLVSLLLPGPGNRLLWDKSASRELIRFGKWIFFSTACGFVVSQGDKLILGKFITLDQLGIYNIGYFLASVPLLLGTTVVWKILIPLYREKPPAQSRDNFHKLRLMRFGLTGSLLFAMLTIAFAGIMLVDTLYDDRYIAAGSIVVLIACVQIPQVIGMSYDQAAIATGDSRGFFFLVATKATTQIAGLLIGIKMAGLLGAMAGQGVGAILAYPMVIWLARRQGAWDPLHDIFYAFTGLGLGAVALWINKDAILMLLVFGGT